MFSDAETTRESFTGDGFSNQAIGGRVVGKQEAVKSFLTSDVDTETIRTRLSQLPHVFHGGEVVWGSASAPSWTSIDDDDDTPYQYLESLTGANVKELRFTVRIKGVQTGYTTSDGDDFVEKISLLQDDAINRPHKYVEYLKKKEFLLRDLSNPTRQTNEPSKYKKVEYPSNIAPKVYTGFHGDERCPFAHLSGVIKGRHDEGEMKQQVRCDGLHMRFNAEKDEYELCTCCGPTNVQTLSPALAGSIFSRVVAGSSEASTTSSAVAAIDAACDSAAMDEENKLPYCINCQTIREQLKSGVCGGSPRAQQKENKEIMNLAYD